MSDKKLDQIISKLELLEHQLAQKPSREEIVLLEKHNEDVDKLLTHIDGFITLHQTLNQDVTMPRNRCDQLEERLLKLESHQSK